MKNIMTSDVSVAYLEYPQNKINPTSKVRKIISLTIPLLFFIITLSASSCKTCNCPAYSMLQGINNGSMTTKQPESGTDKNLNPNRNYHQYENKNISGNGS